MLESETKKKLREIIRILNSILICDTREKVDLRRKDILKNPSIYQDKYLIEVMGFSKKEIEEMRKGERGSKK